MRSPTIAMLWEIWRRNASALGVTVVATMAGRMLDYTEQPTDDPSSLIGLLGMVSFLLLFGVFSYTEASGTRGIGGFPRRMFTLPVSSLRLVALPVCAGIAAVELLYLLWLAPLTRGGTLSPPFVAVLLAASMVFVQTVFWTLGALGPLRLIVAGAVVVGVYGIGLLPSWPPTPAPPWRSERVIGLAVAALAVVAFGLAWWHITRLRCGAGMAPYCRRSATWRTASPPRVRRPFRSPTAAQWWFEWRCAGLVLPVLVNALLVCVVAPFSWLARDDAGSSLRLLLGALATPIVFAVPVGMAFARPTFWSENLSLPAFVAIRPVTDEELVAIRLSVAGASVAMTWLLVVAFVGLWLSLWGNADGVSQLAMQWWAFHEHSVISVYGTAALLLVCAAVLTWRCLVSRLCSGLFGSRPVFLGSVLSVVAIVIAAMVFAVDRLPGWVLADPQRMARLVWLMAGAAVIKCMLAARWWNQVPPGQLRRYLPVWATATTCMLTLAMLLWDVTRIYVALDVYRFQAFMILSALLVVPLARVARAPSCLARNRHS